MRRRPQVAVLVHDGDDAVARQSAVDVQARQLLRWFESLPIEARFEVHDLARRRHAGLAGPSFEVVTVAPQRQPRETP